jgi:hypothetical protein
MRAKATMPCMTTPGHSEMSETTDGPKEGGPTAASSLRRHHKNHGMYRRCRRLPFSFHSNHGDCAPQPNDIRRGLISSRMRFSSLPFLAIAAQLVGAIPAPQPQPQLKPGAISLPRASKTLSARAGTISNPAIWEDFPDLDIFRVGSVYYYSSSTFAYSPGAPLLKSYDLINWYPVTHSVPYLNFGNQYNLTGSSRAYESGIWASTVRYRASTDTWYWYGCIGFSTTYIWTAKGTGAGSNGGDVPDNAWNWQVS